MKFVNLFFLRWCPIIRFPQDAKNKILHEVITAKW